MWWVASLWGVYITVGKKKVLQVTLQLIVFLHCDCYQKVAWLAKLQLVVYMVQFIVTQLQLCWNHSFSTIMQLHYNYNHNVMLTLIIFIHPLKFDTWHYKIKMYFKKYWFPSFIMIVDGPKLWHMA